MQNTFSKNLYNRIRVIKAYIILAHKNPTQVQRLVSRLDDGSSFFYIHIDKNVEIKKFTTLFISTNVRFIKREKSSWGKIGMVKATLNGLEQIEKDNIRFDYVSLLSGQDYPLKSNQEIDNYLRENNGKIFINFFRMPADCWTEGGMKRIQEYWFGNIVNPSYLDRQLNYYVNKLSKKWNFLKRKFPHYLHPYGGSQWWTIPFFAMEYITKFVKKHPDYFRFHKYSFAPDEMFFQTILLNATEDIIKLNIVNDNKRYMDWSKPYCLPAILTIEDIHFIESSNKIFGRKFDISVDNKILDLIDRYL